MEKQNAKNKKNLFLAFRPLLLTLVLLFVVNQSVRLIPHHWFAEASYAENDLRNSDSCNTFPSAFYFQQLLRDIKNNPNYTVVILGDSTVDSHLLPKEDSFRVHLDGRLDELEEAVDEPVSLYVLARCKGMSKDFYYIVKKMVEMEVKPDLLVFNIPGYHFHLELENHTTSEGFNDMVIKDFVNDDDEQESMELFGLNNDETRDQVWLENYLPLYAFRKDLSAMTFGCHPRDFIYSRFNSEQQCDTLPSNSDLNYYTYWRDVEELKGQTKAKHPTYVTRDDLFSDQFIFASYYEKLAELIEEEEYNAAAFTSPLNGYFYNGKWLSSVYQEKKDIVEEITVSNDIAYLDFEQVLGEAYFGDKHHLNAEGTKAFAALMAQTLAQLAEEQHIN